MVSRLAPAILVAGTLGMIVGAIRGRTEFVVGVQGLMFGCFLGLIGGHMGRRDAPADWSWWRTLGATLSVWGSFVLFEFWGIGLGMPHPNAWGWLAGMLDGTLHEPMLGMALGPGRFRGHAFRPGPVAWVLFNLLDLCFMLVMTFVLLRITWRHPPPPQATPETDEEATTS